MPLQNKIMALLKERRVSPHRFQMEIGIAHRTAYDLCNDPDRIPSGKVLEKICDYYGVTPADVLEKVEATQEVVNQS
jgi:DNA-binding Xre family transcriptional regulator